VPRPHQSLYQINTRVWLNELARKLGRPSVTLADVPDEELEKLAQNGFDWIWLLGIWQTGEASRKVSRTDPGLRKEYERALPGFTDDDVPGSPFAVQSYTVHRDFGGDEALAKLRERLKARGLKLLLDFVPNHTALDHPWVTQHPDRFVRGTGELLEREPGNWTRVRDDLILAYGRDPYFAGWTDTLQLDYRTRGVRDAMVAELERIAQRCDGVRCDMAMLVLPEVFSRTWAAAPAPQAGNEPGAFWPDAIARARKIRPDFMVMAEVYWGLEGTLQQQGFDFTYDKTLYDWLRNHDAPGVRKHLTADIGFQSRCARFTENHDEPRAAASFPHPVGLAAAIATYLAPGLRFFHDGQFEGRKIRVPVHLARRADEPVHEGIAAFYPKLLAAMKRPEVREGEWSLLSCRPAWDGNATWDRFLASRWKGADGRQVLIAVNFGGTQGQCYVENPLPDLRGRQVRLRDLMGPASYDRSGDEMASKGLYLDLLPWGYHVFEAIPL
jgi:hypothetical protein